jgi:zinc/manganese transport system substrate-binding protein
VFGFIASGCGMSAGSPAGFASGELRVVASESSWGSIAAQLGGPKVIVSSLIANSNVDPHSYEPTASDGVRIAQSQLAIVNGLGYDAWASKLIAANPSSERVVLDVGKVLKLSEGDNPHQWYSPSSVQRVVRRIAADYERLDPRDASYFAQRQHAFLAGGLAEYDRLRRQIRAHYARVPVGYSESVFAPLGQSLGLRLATPASFAKAIAEGADVSANDKQTVDTQAEKRQIAVWVYNRQNATPDVQRVSQLARASRIPVATITETLLPASATFQQWQDAQLRQLAAALHEATGR